MGVSLIMTHKLTFVQDSVTVCPMCMEEEEDEIHFIPHCPVYHDLRSKYLPPFDSPPNQALPPNVNTVQLLLSSVNESLIDSLCTYLNQAFKRRKQYCDEWWLSLLTIYCWINCILYSFVRADGLSNKLFVFVFMHTMYCSVWSLLFMLQWICLASLHLLKPEIGDTRMTLWQGWTVNVFVAQVISSEVSARAHFDSCVVGLSHCGGGRSNPIWTVFLLGDIASFRDAKPPPPPNDERCC